MYMHTTYINTNIHTYKQTYIYTGMLKDVHIHKCNVAAFVVFDFTVLVKKSSASVYTDQYFFSHINYKFLSISEAMHLTMLLHGHSYIITSSFSKTYCCNHTVTNHGCRGWGCRGYYQNLRIIY